MTQIFIISLILLSAVTSAGYILNKNFTVHCGLAIGYENTKSKINSLKTEREKLENFCKFY